MTTDDFLVIGHRGNEVYDVENTLPAFRRAVVLGANALELDVQLTQDDRLVVFHDRSLRKRTGDPRTVRSVLWEDLQAIPVRGPGGEATIPLFSEILPHLLSLGVLLQIEMKWDDNVLPNILAAALPPALASVQVSSFSLRALEGFHALRPEIPTVLLCDRFGPWGLGALRHLRALRRARRCGATFVSLHRADATPRHIDFFRRAGLTVIAWGIKDPATYHQFIQCGLAGFTASDPGALRAALDQVRREDHAR
jgi:glycerophosphoryl diester phosphodiesterase